MHPYCFLSWVIIVLSICIAHFTFEYDQISFPSKYPFHKGKYSIAFFSQSREMISDYFAIYVALCKLVHEIITHF